MTPIDEQQHARPNDPLALNDRLALITGAGSGLGLAMSQALAAAGARVIMVGRNEEKLMAAAHTVGANAETAMFDVTRVQDTGDFVTSLGRRHGPIDILINNAGVHMKKPLEETSTDDVEAIFRSHTLSSFALAAAVVPSMKERRWGRIISISSMSALLGLPNVVAYSIAKAALSGMTRCLAAELGPFGIRVNAIAPGFIETDMFRAAVSNDAPRLRKILERTPTGTIGLPADIASAAAFLASDAASFINGQILPVDGGAQIGF